MADDIDVLTLNERIAGPENLFTFLTESHLIPSTKNCPRCGNAMKLQKKGNRNGVGKIWACDRASCTLQRSIILETVFEATKLSIKIHLNLFLYFILNTSAKKCQEYLGSHISYPSVLRVYSICKLVCALVLQNEFADFKFTSHTAIQLKGWGIDTEDTGEGVEGDESWFGKKRKYNRGTGKQTTMVFGLVDRKSGKTILKIVPTNSRDVLFPIIFKRVDTSCRIFHDGLATYNSLGDHHYEHETVNHSETFSDGNGVHTNTIEGKWGNIKQKIASMHGLPSEKSLKALLAEESYRTMYNELTNGQKWKKFLEHIVQYGYEAVELYRNKADIPEM